MSWSQEDGRQAGRKERKQMVQAEEKLSRNRKLLFIKRISGPGDAYFFTLSHNLHIINHVAQ